MIMSGGASSAMKRWIVVFLLMVPLLASAESYWEGNAALQRGDTAFESGLYAASNSFPPDTQLTVTNLETSRSTAATVSGRIEGQSDILILLSPKAADAIGLASGKHCPGAHHRDADGTHRGSKHRGKALQSGHRCESRRRVRGKAKHASGGGPAAGRFRPAIHRGHRTAGSKRASRGGCPDPLRGSIAKPAEAALPPPEGRPEVRPQPAACTDGDAARGDLADAGFSDHGDPCRGAAGNFRGNGRTVRADPRGAPGAGPAPVSGHPRRAAGSPAQPQQGRSRSPARPSRDGGPGARADGDQQSGFRPRLRYRRREACPPGA